MTKETYYEIIDKVGELIKGTQFVNNVFSVGGCVRDLLMGNEIKDIDMCVSLPDGGIKLAEFMQENGYTKGSVVTYPTYGTAMFKLKEFPDIDIEVVQTRGEQYHDKDSRNPVTTFAPIEEDAFRRDLTINALYQNIITKEILDPTNSGFSDIKNHIIRCTRQLIQ